MKKYLINIPALNRNFYLELPKISFAKDLRINSFGNLIDWMFYNLFPVGLFIFVFIKIFYSNTELSVLNYLIVNLFICFFLFGARLILFGKRILIDPPLFLSVLLFALLTTTASILVIPANPLNTFGTSTFRLLSGVSILIFVGIFYFTRTYLYSRFSIKNVMRAISLGFLTYLTLALFNSSSLGLIDLITLIILSGFFLIYFLGTKQRKLIKASLLLVLLFGILIQLISKSGLASIVNLLLILFFVTTLLIDVFLFTTNNLIFQKLFLEYRISIKNLRKNISPIHLRRFLRNFVLIIMILSPAILFGIIIANVLRDNSSFAFVNIAINNIKVSVEYLFSLAQVNFTKLLTGSGFSAFNANYSLFANLIRVQGLLGVVAYSILGSYAVYKWFKLLKLGQFNNRVVLAVGFILIATPVLSIFIYPSLFLVIFWWICFAMLSFLLKPNMVVEPLNQINLNVEPFKLGKFVNQKWGKVLKVIFVLLLLLFSLYSLISFVNIVKLY